MQVLIKEYKEDLKIQIFWDVMLDLDRLLDPEDEGTANLQIIGNYSSSDSIRPHKTGIFSNTAVTTSNLMKATLTSSLQQQ
jgi:hypothetical protein